MEDDTKSEDGPQTFEVEFTASQLYSLHGLLRHISFNMDHRNSVVAQSLAKHVHEPMVTTEFNDAMEQEIDEYEERMDQNPHDEYMEQESGDSIGFGVQ